MNVVIKYLLEEDLKVFQKILLLYLNSEEGKTFNTEKEISKRFNRSGASVCALLSELEEKKLVGWSRYIGLLGFVDKNGIKQTQKNLKIKKRDRRNRYWGLTLKGEKIAAAFEQCFKIILEAEYVINERTRDQSM